MATGYARQSSGSIVTAATIEAAHFNNEYNAIEAAFDETTGHNHDGTTDGGAKITPAALSGVDGNGIIARTTSSNFEARTLTAPAAGITVTNGDGVSGNPTLVLADDLAGLEGMSSTGHVVRTGSGTYANRTLTAPAAGITVTNGDGVSGNPTLVLANDLSAYEGLASTGVVVRTGDGTATTRSITAPAAGITVTNGDGVAGAPTLALANDLAAYEGLAANGLVARTGDGTASARTITAPAAGITIADGDGVAGNPTLSLAHDLSGLEGLSGTGLAVRTGTSTWTNRTITASLGVAVTNGDGVSAAPAFTLDINGLTTDASPDAAADYVATYDASATTHKKILLNSISPSAASTSAAGIVELATSAETITGTDTARAITPEGGAAAYGRLGTANTFTAAQTIAVTAAGTALTLESTDAGSSSGPNLVFYRNSATPADGDSITSITFTGEDSAGNTETYAGIAVEATDITSTTEDGTVTISTVAAGTLATRATIAQGLQVGSPTGGDKGAATINATFLYQGGNKIGWELITFGTVTSAASLSVTDLSSSYAAYKLIFDELAPESDGVSLYFRTDTNNGVSFESGASDYGWHEEHNPAGGTWTTAFDAADSQIQIGRASSWGTGAEEDGSGEITIYNPMNADTRTRIGYDIGYFNSTPAMELTRGGGWRLTAEANNAFVVFFSTGDIATMNYTVYGLRAS